jgi:methylated-DNA-[protein]-cysteine S-methyltransferase
MRAAAEDETLMGLWFEGQRHYPEDWSSWIDSPGRGVFRFLRQWLQGYFKGEKTPADLAIAPRGTAFQGAVWAALREIPYGSTVPYGEIARRLASRRGRSAAARAVGGAVGRNPLSLIIPCHRVVGSDGSLTGYAGGIVRKRALLRLEKADGF